MIVKKSSIIGYCYGVSNTIQLAQECLNLAQEKGLPCYSLGKLIHNEDVVAFFELKGLKTIKTPEGNEPGVALIRAHGIKDSERRTFQQANFQLIDSTCPTVQKGLKAVKTAAKEGKTVILLGFDGHAETLGLQGVEVEEGILAKTVLLSSLEEAEQFVRSKKFSPEEPLAVVTQTTFPEDAFKAITELLKREFRNIGIKNCPCAQCGKRERAGYELACKCDCAVVVGGRKSANTKNLAEVAKKSGKPVFLVENAMDLVNSEGNLQEELKKYRTVALLSGSSTPIVVVDAVATLLQNIK